MKKTQLTLGFGVMCDPVEEQLSKQNFRYKDEINPEARERIQSQVVTIKVLQIQGIIADSEFHKIANRYVKMLSELVVPVSE